MLEENMVSETESTSSARNSASQNRGKHQTSHNKRASKEPENLHKSESSSPKASISKKPQISTEFVEDDTSSRRVIDNPSIFGPEVLNERIQKLNFGGKGKESINGRPDGGLGSFSEKEAGKDASKSPDILLVVDLNSRNPVAAFNAPSLGFSQYKFLPALKAMSKASEAFLTSSKSGRSSFQSSPDWTKEFLSHCQALLQSELSKPMEYFKLQVFFTARGDASDRNKAMLLEAVKDAGFIVSAEDGVQIFPTIEAVTIEVVRRHVPLGLNSNKPYRGAAPKANHNILIMHYDGDVAEIQSYSVSWAATTGRFFESRLRLEEISYGETLDFGKQVDHQFARWIEDSFGKSTSNISANNVHTDAQLMAKFAEVRRNYQAYQSDVYEFPLTLQSPAYGAPYDSHRRICQVQDSEIRRFFEPAMGSLLKSLDNHHTRVGQKKKTMDNIIFAGASCISPYVEGLLKDWGIGLGLLNTNIQVFPVSLGRYIRFEPTPEILVQGVIHGNYPGVEVVPRFRAHYGFRLAKPFEDGDPAWSRFEDNWDNIDMCDVRVIWQVQKDQLLDSHATVSAYLTQIFRQGERLNSSIKLYRCELHNPPRWVRIHQSIPNQDIQLVGSVAINFTEEDFRDGEYKLCNDQVYRRKLRFTVRVLCGHHTRTLRVSAMSADGQRELGRASFRYE